MVRIVTLLFDSFKGSIGAPQVGRCVAEALGERMPDAKFVNFPASDGGDGFGEAIGYHVRGRPVRCLVTGPLGEPVPATYLWNDRSHVAIMESAQANGLTLVPPERRDPLHTMTCGVGDMLVNAVNRGAKKIIVGVGGSATVDGGAGMARAIGYTFLDENTDLLTCEMAEFEKVADIIPPGHSPIEGAEILVACDVRTRLLGRHSSIWMYGPQKGGTPESLALIERRLRRLDKLVRKTFHKPFGSLEMGGAAGGLAAGLAVFAGAKLRRGMELFDELTGMDAQVSRSALVITGEGRLDEQSAEGKVVSYVAESCRRHRVPVIALCGSVTKHTVPLDGVFALTDSGMPATECIARPTEAIGRVAPALATAANEFASR